MDQILASASQEETLSKVRPVLEKMVIELMKEQPKDVAIYMINYLQKNYGYTSTCLTINEKKELEQLRLKVKQYREMDRHNEDGSDPGSQSQSDEEDDVDKTLDEIPPNKKKLSLIPRSAVSAEAYGEFNKRESFVARSIPKSEDQIQRIKARITHSFLFNNLDGKDLGIVINAMDEKKFKAGQNVITQGEDGDCLYVIEEGHLDCFKKFPDGETKRVKQYSPGDSFGELALLYNCPRAATVTATDDVVTFVLDRETFNHIVKEAAQKKREKYEDFLKKVEILSTIDPYELMQISDALRTAVFHKNDYIIKEGELGDVFYILEEGECVATKVLEPGKGEKEIKGYKKGDYFGERALIKGEARYCNIVAKSELVKVISLDRESFKRLLGPIEDILKRNMEKYETFVLKETAK